MAISFVGANGGNSINAQSVTVNLPAGRQAGDLILVAFGVGDDDFTQPTLAITTAGYTEVTSSTLSADGGTAGDANLAVFYKFHNGTDTNVVTTAAGTGTDSSCAVSVMMFRGVAGPGEAGPFDAAAVPDSGTSGGDPNPPQISFTSAGVWTVIAGAVGNTGALTLTGPANYTTNFRNDVGDDAFDTSVGLGYNSSPTSPENPGVMTDSGAGAAWCALTMALKPAVMSPAETAYRSEAKTSPQQRLAMGVAGLTIAISLLQSTLAPAGLPDGKSLRGVVPEPRPAMAVSRLTIARGLQQSTLAPLADSTARHATTVIPLACRIPPPIGAGSLLLTTLSEVEEPPADVSYRDATTPIPKARMAVPPAVGESGSTPVVLSQDLANTTIFGTWADQVPVWPVARVPDVGAPRSPVLDAEEVAPVETFASVVYTTLRALRPSPSFYSFTSSLVEAPEYPVTTTEWRLPVTRPPALSVTYTQARGRVLDVIAVEDPQKPRDWPLPPARPPIRLDTTRSHILALSPSMGVPFRQTAWPTPSPRPAVRVDFTAPRWMFAVEPMAQTPFFGAEHTVLPPPRTPALRTLTTWTQAKPTYYVDQSTDILRHRQTDWPIPAPRLTAQTQNLRQWTHRKPTYYVDQLPPHQTDWPNPRLPKALPGTVGFTQNRPTYYVEAAPARQTAWPNPTLPRVLPPTCTQNLLQTTLAPAPVGRQTDWPIFRATVQPAGLQTHLQARPTYYVEIQGFNQFDWPLPPPVPRALEVRIGWTHSHPLVLPLGPVAKPACIIQVQAEDVIVRIPADPVATPADDAVVIRPT